MSTSQAASQRKPSSPKKKKGVVTPREGKADMRGGAESRPIMEPRWKPRKQMAVALARWVSGIQLIEGERTRRGGREGGGMGGKVEETED